jgi:hypothetical protein
MKGAIAVKSGKRSGVSVRFVLFRVTDINRHEPVEFLPELIQTSHPFLQSLHLFLDDLFSEQNPLYYSLNC